MEALSSLPKRVLVTGGRAPSCADFVVQLRDAGVQVWVGDCISYPMTRFIPGVESFQYPSPVHDPGGFQTKILELIDQHQIERVIPHSEEVFHLSHFASDIQERCDYWAPSLELLHPLHHKLHVTQHLQGLGLKIPRTLELAQFLQQVPASEYLPTDWIVKAKYSRFNQSTLISPSYTQLQALPASEYIIQERLVGLEVSSYAWFDQGHLLTQVSYQATLRYSGAAIGMKPIELPQIKSFLKNLGQRDHIHGQLSFDFMYHQGVLSLIECNPRATSGVHLLGSKHPKLLYPAIFLAIISQPSLLLRSHLYKTVIESHGVLWDKLSWRSWWIWIPSWVGFCLHSLRTRRSLNQSTTEDIQWDGDQHASE